MVALPDQSPPRNLWEMVRRTYQKASEFVVGKLLPKRLYARALLIIIVPIVLLECVVAFVFMERHWQYVTRRLSQFTAREIAAIIDIYQNYQLKDNYKQLRTMAKRDLNLTVNILPPGDLPPARPRPFFDLLDRTLSREIRLHVKRPFWIDTVGRSKFVEIRIKLEDAVLRVTAERSHTYSSNSHIFLIWMGSSSLLLLGIAIIFMRNQIKPILNLAAAADNFGKGRPVPDGFKPRGALEVRQASHAFIEMRDRIEKHVEQRTTMLAGVSHDLRTILTRFRLQLAMLQDQKATDAMLSDINEMQLMLEDYLAFSKGDSGEETAQTDVVTMLEEVRDEALHFGKPVKLDIPKKSIQVALRRHGFKRAVANLVNNAIRYADHVSIRGQLTRKWLIITVEDDGPGIPHSEREAVFRPFYRVDGSRNQNEGGNTGLGLSIARDIAQSHGGDITLGDSKMGGLEATIRIPV